MSEPASRPARSNRSGGSTAHLGYRVIELERRMDQIENDLRKMNDPQTGIVATFTGQFHTLTNRLNVWGSLLLGAAITAGLISNDGAAIIRSILGVG